jgi:hypothetical protein
MKNTAKILILDGPRSPHRGHNLAYRGTYRSHPSYCDSLPKDHEVNRLFMWYLEEGGELGVVHDLSKALRYAELCNECFPSRHFEVVKVTEGEVLPNPKWEFLGFDLSQGYNNSLLYWGLKSKQSFDRNNPVDVLWQVVSRFFAPQLNEHGLFSNIDAASFCLSSMIALQSLKANMFEGDELAKFHVVGIWLVLAEGQSIS